MTRKVAKTDLEWRELLTKEQYDICRCGGTEPAFSGKYCDNKEEGVYRCIACSCALFSSDCKFDSGTGWPSFTQPINPGHIETKPDYSHGMVRTEVRCADCGSHLGHVFREAHITTGQRYCINSASLDFVKNE